MPFVSLLSFLYYNIFCQKNQPLLYQYNCYYEKTGSEVKNITDEIPFDIPDSWCWVRVKNLGILKSGYAFKSSEYVEQGIQIVRISDLGDNEILKKNAVFYPLSKELVDYLVIRNSFLICQTGSIGKMALVQDDIPRYLNQRVGMFIPLEENNLKYLWRFFHTSYVFNLWLSAKTSTNGNIKNADILDLYLPLPPLAEQKRIVAEIEKFEPLIAEYDRLEQQATKLDGEIYDKLKKSILQYAIQGKLVPQDSNDEPAAVLLERIRAEKKAQLGKKYVESYIFKGDDNCYYEKVGKNEPVLLENLPFDIPDSWCWARFIDIVSFENGDRSNKYPVEENYVPFGIPFWGAKDIINNKLTPTNNLRYISQAKFNELGNGKLQNNDFVCLLRGAVGKWASFETNETITTGFINAQMVIIRPQSKSFTEWLKVYFSSPLFSQLCENFTSGTAVAQMSAKDLSKFYVPIPPYNEQIRIYNQIEIALDKLKDEN